MSSSRWRTACAIMLAENTGEPTAALLYLRNHCQNKGVTESACAKKLRTWWSEVGPLERDRLRDHPNNKEEALARKAGLRFLWEQNLDDWVFTQNSKKGLAPRSDAVLRKMRTFTEEGRPGSADGSKRKSRLQWLRRWRGRWSCHMARLMPRESMSKELMHLKVVAPCC